MEDGIGSGDLYISYHSTEGTWSKSKNLSAKINSDKMDYCPFYDSKTQILYFTSKRNEIITKRSKSLELKHLLKMMHSYQNGLSRIYKTHIKL
ncbi:hypothetical protein [Aquimarina sp. I32.4]|uniref:hypothetical protein n=1 Tax=Aquimarina sp. I32.4 TaxID=2053903 RepID=UPI000CDE75B4|nr:hypothetical protein [Aquimarina sp. I32.4]